MIEQIDAAAWYTLTEAAKKAGVSRQSVFDWVKIGIQGKKGWRTTDGDVVDATPHVKLESFEFKGLLLIPAEALETFLNEQCRRRIDHRDDNTPAEDGGLRCRTLAQFEGRGRLAS